MALHFLLRFFKFFSEQVLDDKEKACQECEGALDKEEALGIFGA